MLPCNENGGCVYKGSIPGDCHIKCTFDFRSGQEPNPPQFNAGPNQAQWFYFPFNFDPIWGDGCSCKKEYDESLVGDPFFDLLSLL